MDTQITLFDAASAELQSVTSETARDSSTVPTASEREVFSILEPYILKVCDDLNLFPGDFTLSAGAGYSSIKFDTCLIMRLKFRGKRHFISFPKAYTGNMSDDIELEYSKSEPGYARINTDLEKVYSLMPTLQRIIRSAILHIPKEYDCCSQYLECSNAKKCLKEDRKSALVCGYKKILESGTIYYGENRTIDKPYTEQ